MRRIRGSGNRRWPVRRRQPQRCGRRRARLAWFMPVARPDDGRAGDEGKGCKDQRGQVQKRAERAPFGMVVAGMAPGLMPVLRHAVHHGMMMERGMFRRGRFGRGRGNVDARQPYDVARGNSPGRLRLSIRSCPHSPRHAHSTMIQRITGLSCRKGWRAWPMIELVLSGCKIGMVTGVCYRMCVIFCQIRMEAPQP